MQRSRPFSKRELAFWFFGGVFRRLRYDNLAAAVKKIFRGYRREETSRFVAFAPTGPLTVSSAHPPKHMKKMASTEKLAIFDGNHWVPVPHAADLADLNRQLLSACRQDEARWISGRSQSIGCAVLVEREHLLPLAAEGMDLAWNSSRW